MDELDINYETVLMSKENLKGISDDISEEVRRLGYVIKDVEACWKSSYTKDYVDGIIKTQKNLSSISENIANLSKTTNGLIEQLQAKEQKLKSNM